MADPIGPELYHHSHSLPPVMGLGLGPHLVVGLVGDDSVEPGYRPPRAGEMETGMVPKLAMALSYWRR